MIKSAVNNRDRTGHIGDRRHRWRATISDRAIEVSIEGSLVICLACNLMMLCVLSGRSTHYALIGPIHVVRMVHLIRGFVRQGAVVLEMKRSANRRKQQAQESKARNQLSDWSFQLQNRLRGAIVYL